MAASRWIAAAGLALAAALSAAPAADLCEGCWEVLGRGSVLIPSGDAGLDPAGGFGAGGAFRFRPYWSVEFAVDRYAGAIPDGPAETVTFLSTSFTYTFRAARDQRSRPYGSLVLGYAWTHVASYRTQVRGLTAESRPASDGSVSWALGVGGATSLGSRAFLRYELRGLDWSSFGAGREAISISVGVGIRLGD